MRAAGVLAKGRMFDMSALQTAPVYIGLTRLEVHVASNLNHRRAKAQSFRIRLIQSYENYMVY